MRAKAICGTRQRTVFRISGEVSDFSLFTFRYSLSCDGSALAEACGLRLFSFSGKTRAVTSSSACCWFCDLSFLDEFLVFSVALNKFQSALLIHDFRSTARKIAAVAYELD